MATPTALFKHTAVIAAHVTLAGVALLDHALAVAIAEMTIAIAEALAAWRALAPPASPQAGPTA